MARLAGAVVLFASLALPGLGHAQSANQRIQSDLFAARTGLPRGWIVSNKPGVVVAIRDRDSLGARTPGEKVRLQGEIVDDEAAERLGYRSMRSAVEVNCETRRDRVLEMEVFDSPNLKGTGRKRTVPGGWVQPSQDAYMADVIRTVCRGPQRQTETVAPPEPPLVTRPAPSLDKPTTKTAPAREPISRLLQAPAEIGADGPGATPDPRIPASPEAPITTAPRVPRFLTPPPPAPTVAPASQPVAEPVRPKSKPKPVAPPPPGPLHRAVAGGLTVQVGALDNDADARRALKSVESLTAGGFVSTVQAVKVEDRTFYRALVSGFADRADAKAFCLQVARKGGTCLIR
jgi:cell division septation protein DedD